MFNTKNFDQYFIGFDKFANQISTVLGDTAKLAMKYPPYNIRKVEDNKYVIELGVAGFGEQDIEIEIIDDKLVIKGNSKSDETDESFLYRGLALRPFTRQFYLNDRIEVGNAELINGVLKVFLEAVTPQDNSRKVEINKGK